MAKVELPLIRTRDKKNVGTLKLIQTMHTSFTDRDGQLRRRRARLGPVGEDHLGRAHGQNTKGLGVPEEDELAVGRPAGFGRRRRRLL